ncbi:hypothetical protein ADUPG1_011943 [Aduncisulcus paluster]|uniref:Uncharacterized protein n=1 Tax=Aduncisulcus paluster TaxID=2918883 RepID=A0ABQ5JXN6_9EUKA|nr:hypothetical protein ADUPG1_011943 [Aduncisulcus paluster]
MPLHDRHHFKTEDSESSDSVWDGHRIVSSSTLSSSYCFPQIFDFTTSGKSFSEPHSNDLFRPPDIIYDTLPERITPDFELFCPFHYHPYSFKESDFSNPALNIVESSHIFSIARFGDDVSHCEIPQDVGSMSTISEKEPLEEKSPQSKKIVSTLIVGKRHHPTKDDDSEEKVDEFIRGPSKSFASTFIWKTQYFSLKKMKLDRSVRDCRHCVNEFSRKTLDNEMLFLLLLFRQFVSWDKKSTTKVLLFRRCCCGVCLRSSQKFWGNINRPVPYFVFAGRIRRIWEHTLQGWTFSEIYMEEFVEYTSGSERDMLLLALKELYNDNGVNPVTKRPYSTFIMDEPINLRLGGLYLPFMFLLATGDASKGKELSTLDLLPEINNPKGVKKDLYLLFMNAPSAIERRQIFDAVFAVSKCAVYLK